MVTDLAEVCGQEAARRALEVAAAGGHSLLLIGPAGAGKSMLAHCLPGLLPADGETPQTVRVPGLGLTPRARLWLVELPMASRSILAGIKTAAVINVGTATIGGLIGAGGYGQPIITGTRLNDLSIILQGAIPAAVMALAVQGLFELAERFVVPKGLRLASAG